MDLLELATLFHLYVVTNLPLTFATFAAFVAVAAFGMLPSAVVHDDTCCDAATMSLSKNNLMSL